VRTTLRVHYPSGQTFSVAGVLREVELGGGTGLCPGILRGDGEMVVLDPRAVIIRDGAIVAEPRGYDPARLAPWVRDWLAEHPEWPRVVTESPA
jgi:hypothetical protein